MNIPSQRGVPLPQPDGHGRWSEGVGDRGQIGGGEVGARLGTGGKGKWGPDWE